MQKYLFNFTDSKLINSNGIRSEGVDGFAEPYPIHCNECTPSMFLCCFNYSNYRFKIKTAEKKGKPTLNISSRRNMYLI